ncbi:unnamed protein product [Ranitomeya imitator]|uniref:Mannosyltransferase n=1 Tax=Ranitomeya imitator TaxID=111125 RepID=A0ABN9L7T5_9NEOB|nr:unnamed protein product [Ranitomeya imitator]
MEVIRSRALPPLRRPGPVPLRKRKSKLYSKDGEDAGAGLFGENVYFVVFAVAFRVLNCFLVRTSFVPDEYWQSLEVAHNMTFQYPLNSDIAELSLDGADNLHIFGFLD